MTSNIAILDTQSRKYHDILRLLADENCLVYNYALSETIRLIEGLVHHNERIEDRNVIDFALKTANHLSDYKCTHYNDSTIVQLELILNAMSLALCILSQSVNMIHSDTRISLYKSVSKFWKVYRKSTYINANVMFRLREIRTCLRIIDDDQSNLDNFVSTGSKVIETIYNVVNSEYLSALSSVTHVLNFEYSAGNWYDDWKEMHETYFKLRQQYLENNLQLDSIKKFFRKLIKLSTKEFDRVKRKNTKYRNLEYKVLKTGGEILGYSLPDNIDTLLIGYLTLIQRILEEFFPQIKGYIKKILPLCNEIIGTHVKKQLTFKAVEVLYAIKENTQKVEIKDEIESNFEIWSNFSVTMTTSSRPLSSYTVNSTYTTPDTPTSIPKNRKLGFPKIKKANPQKDPQQQRKQIIEGVNKLFEERRKVYKNINETKMEYSKLLEDRAIDEHSIVSKLKEILEKKRKENERKDNIEYIKSLEDKVIDEQTLLKLKEVLGGESGRKDEIGLILSNLKQILEGNRKSGEIGSILSKLKEILERNVEEEPIFEEVSIIEEASTTEEVEEKPSTVKKVPSTDNTNDADDAKQEAANADVIEEIKVDIVISDNDMHNVERVNHHNPIEFIFDADEIFRHQNYSDSYNAVANDVNDVNDVNEVNDMDLSHYSDHNLHNLKEEFDDILYIDNYEILFDVDNILEHQKYLDGNVIISKYAVVNNVSDVSDAEDLLQYSNYNLTEEFDDTLYLDNYEIIFDVDEILGHQKNLDDNIIILYDAVVSDVNIVKYVNDMNDVKDLPQYNNHYFIEEFDDTLYLDYYEVIFDVDEILKHQNYLDDVVISDNAVKIATDLNDANDANDTKILLNISTKNYIYNYYNVAEEFVDELCLVDYEMSDEEIPPPPYSEKDDDNLIALKESLPSPYNECDINTLKNILPSNYNKLDNNIIINIIQEKYIIHVQENNVQDNESSWFKTFKKIVKEVENLVDKAAKAHQAAVDNEKKRRLSSNPSKPELSEKEKEAVTQACL